MVNLYNETIKRLNQNISRTYSKLSMHILENTNTNVTNITNIETLVFTNVSISNGVDDGWCTMVCMLVTESLTLSDIIVKASLIKFVCTLTPIIWVIIYCFNFYDTYLKDKCFRSSHWCDCLHCITHECADVGCRRQNRLRKKITLSQRRRNDQLIQTLG